MGVYYAGGMAYLDLAGQKMKQEVSSDELGTMFGDQTEMTSLALLSEDELKGATYKKENGKVIVSLVLPKEELQKLLGESFDSILDMTGASKDDLMDMVDWKDVTAEFIINEDGYMTEQNIRMGLSVTAEGETGEVNMLISVKFVDPGKDFTITPPDDLDSYKAA